MDRIGAIVHVWPTTFPAANQPRPVVNPAGEKSADSALPPTDAETAGAASGPETAASPKPAQSAGSQQPQDAQTAALISQLAQRDRQVRAHEAAHVAAGGMYVRGGARLSYTTGPDGRAYATGGEVSIDRSPVPNDPQATLRKLQQVQRAALAPVDPSPQDRAVAAAAAMSITQAQLELAQRQLNAYRGTENPATTARSSGFRATA